MEVVKYETARRGVAVRVVYAARRLVFRVAMERSGKPLYERTITTSAEASAAVQRTVSIIERFLSVDAIGGEVANAADVSESKFAPENEEAAEMMNEPSEPATAADEVFHQESAEVEIELRCEDGSDPPCVSSYRAASVSGKARKAKRERKFERLTVPAGHLVMEQEWMIERAKEGALFVLNHSGGKDSQAAMILVMKLLADYPQARVVVIHANLPGADWPGASDHAQAQAEAAGVPFLLVTAKWSAKNGGKVKTFLSMVERRFKLRPEVPSWPSKGQRQCTSDLKRGPLTVAIRAYANSLGAKLIVDVEGLRAQESDDRAACHVVEAPKSLQKRGKRWYKYRPVKHLLTGEVFQTIADAGQKPHFAYFLGNERFSCIFCIYGSDGDIRNGALYAPETFAEYVGTEKRTGYTMHMNRRPLEEIAGVTVEEAFRQRRHLPIITNSLRGLHRPPTALTMASSEVIEPPKP